MMLLTRGASESEEDSSLYFGAALVLEVPFVPLVLEEPLVLALVSAFFFLAKGTSESDEPR